MRYTLKVAVLFIIALLAATAFFAVYRGKSAREPARLESAASQAPQENRMETLTLTTNDGVRIAAEYYTAVGDRGALLVHMMPATKESWRGFAEALQERGYHALAIDLRGHGESSGGPDSYRRFTDADHQKSIADLEAGAAFLKEKGVLPERIVVIGASIGANLSLQYLAEHPETPQAVVLSAGLDYRGVVTGPLAAKLQAGQRVFFATSEDDDDNTSMSQTLFDRVPEGIEKKLIVYRRAGHGTDMFGKESPDLATAILDWLK